MQNKANLQKAQMNVKSFRTSDYDNFAALRLRKNKANSKPKAGLCRKLEALNAESRTRTFNRARFEKTKPIFKSTKWR